MIVTFGTLYCRGKFNDYRFWNPVVIEISMIIVFGTLGMQLLSRHIASDTVWDSTEEIQK